MHSLLPSFGGHHLLFGKADFHKMKGRETQQSHNDGNTTDGNTGLTNHFPESTELVNVRELKGFVFKISFDFLSLFFIMLGQNHV
jgi:hypothetical protein